MKIKNLSYLFILTLFACGGGGGGETPAASSGGSASSANATILYSPATQCTLTSISSSLTNFPDSSNACNQPLSTTMKTILAANMNNPISAFTDSQFYYTSDLSSSIQTQLRTAIDDAAAIFGYFDLYFFGIGSDLTAFNSSVKQNFCDAFGYATCGSDGTLQYLINIANGTTPNDGGANVIGFNPNDSSTPPKKAYSIYQGLNNEDALETIAIHEYYHIYQHATTIGMSNESNIRKMPPWYSEGTAQYVAEWLAREKGYAETADTFSSKMGELWEEAVVAYGNGTRVKDGEQYPINNSLSVWAVAFMIEKATARSGITNGAQEILVTIPNQVNEKGWYKTFQDNTGITLETFYTQFNSALSANDKSTRVSNLVTSNFADPVTGITGKYNYSVLQLTGADTLANSGGTPTADARTLYFYDNDTSTIPSYQGGYSGAWPYVVTSKNISKGTEITASITKNVSGNYVLVANKPVYQYASDTASSKSGATINLWKAIKSNGTEVDGTKIAP